MSSQTVEHARLRRPIQPEAVPPDHPDPSVESLSNGFTASSNDLATTIDFQHQERTAGASTASTSAPSTNGREGDTDSKTSQSSALRQVEDLTQKKCWICYDDESSTPGRPFVHACDCSLVSHRDCLLEWINTYQTTQRAAPHCPVCAVPYVIKEQKSEILAMYKALVRRWDRASMGFALGGLVGGAWVATSFYGAWAIRMFAGEQVASALLFRHERWPLSYYVNLPLVPLTLILSRTTLIDSFLPFLPLTLTLSTSARISPADPLGLDNLSFSYPPSPTLTLCLLPWARLIYLRVREAVFKQVLGGRASPGGLAGLMVDLENQDDMLEGQGFELMAEVQVDGLHPGGGQNHHNFGAENDVDNVINVIEEPPRVADRLRVGVGRFTRLIVGALIFPALSAGAGGLLFWLASRKGNNFRWLRTLLGVQALLSVSQGAGGSAFGKRSSWLSLLASTVNSNRGSVVDPVWIRNTIGGGLILLIRDAVELFAGVLERNRKASRNIVGRAFGPSLDLEVSTPPRSTSNAVIPTSTNEQTSARRRPSVVHTML